MGSRFEFSLSKQKAGSLAIAAAEDLSSVLQGHRATQQSATGLP